MEYRLCNNTYFSLFFFVSRAYLLRKALDCSGSDCRVRRFLRSCVSRRSVRRAEDGRMLKKRAALSAGHGRVRRSVPTVSCGTFRAAFGFRRVFRLAGKPCRRGRFCRVVPCFRHGTVKGLLTKQNTSCARARGILILDSAIARSSLTTAESPRRTICSFPFS